MGRSENLGHRAVNDSCGRPCCKWWSRLLRWQPVCVKDTGCRARERDSEREAGRAGESKALPAGQCPKSQQGPCILSPVQASRASTLRIQPRFAEGLMLHKGRDIVQAQA